MTDDQQRERDELEYQDCREEYDRHAKERSDACACWMCSLVRLLDAERAKTAHGLSLMREKDAKIAELLKYGV